MQPITTVIIFIMALGTLALLVWMTIGFFTIIWNLGTATPPRTTDASDDIDGMNNGDYYNGPGGYHATDGYENSHYGQIYDHDEEDEHH